MRIVLRAIAPKQSAFSIYALGFSFVPRRGRFALKGNAPTPLLANVESPCYLDCFAARRAAFLNIGTRIDSLLRFTLTARAQ